MNVFKALNAFIAAAIFLGSALAARQYVVLRIMPQAGPVRAEARQAVAQAEGQPDASRYEDIFAGGVFGKGKFTVLGYSAKGPGAGPGAARGDVALVGTAVGGRGYAIFQETQSRRQALVEKGEEVFNIGVLTRIERDRAFVLSNGRELVFYMPAEEKPPGAPPIAAPGGRPPLKGVAVPQGGGGWIIDRRALDDVLANTDKLLTDARLLPYSDKGRTSGFTISEIKPGGLFSLMGFVNGDVILKVNDYGIDSPEKAAQILSGIKGESSVTLDILRDGQPRRLSYQIR